MLELLRRSQSVAKFFCSNFGFLQKKSFCTDKDILFSLFMSFSKRKKKGHQSERSTNILVFCWLRVVNKGVASRTTAAYGFRREIKTPVFGGRKNAGLHKKSVQKWQKKYCIFCTSREHCCLVLFACFNLCSLVLNDFER